MTTPSVDRPKRAAKATAPCWSHLGTPTPEKTRWRALLAFLVGCLKACAWVIYIFGCIALSSFILTGIARPWEGKLPDRPVEAGQLLGDFGTHYIGVISGDTSYSWDTTGKNEDGAIHKHRICPGARLATGEILPATWEECELKAACPRLPPTLLVRELKPGGPQECQRCCAPLDQHHYENARTAEALCNDCAFRQDP